MPALQAICDSLDEDKIEALARKWLDILPSPYSKADQAAGYRYDISILQAEFSLTHAGGEPVVQRGEPDPGFRGLGLGVVMP